MTLRVKRSLSPTRTGSLRTAGTLTAGILAATFGPLTPPLISPFTPTLFDDLGMFQAQAQDQLQGSDAAYQQFLFAYRLLERDELTMAAEAFDTFLLEYPNDRRAGDVSYYRALILRKQGDIDGAVRVLQDAPPPTMLETWRPTMLQGQLLADARNLPRAVAVLQNIDSDDLPDAARAELTYTLGRIYRQREDLPAAIQQLQRCAEIASPFQPRALLELAQAQLRFGDDQAGATLAAAAETDDPQVVPEALRLTGDLARMRQDLPAAEAAYRQVVQRFGDTPAFGPSVVGLMSVYAGRGQTQGVADLYESVVRRLPAASAPSAAYLVGSAYLGLNRPVDAERVLQPIAALREQYPPGDAVLYELARAQFAQQKWAALEQTVNALSAGFAASPRLADVEFLGAVGQIQRGDGDGALRALARIVDTPDHRYLGQAYLQRAALHEAARRPDAALDDYLAYFEAVPIPDDTPTSEQAAAMLRLLYLGHAQRRFELVKGVAQHWARTMQLAPATREDLLYRLGLAAWVAQDVPVARESFDTLAADFPDAPHRAAVTYYQGRIALLDGDSDSAIQRITAATEDASLPAPLQAEAFRILQAHYVQEGETQRAAEVVQRLEDVIGREALEPRDILWLGEQTRIAGQPEAALSYFQSLMDRPAAEPRQRARAAYLAGLAERDRGRPAAAVTWFERVQSFDAGWQVEAQIEAASARASAGDSEAALLGYRQLFSCGAAQIEARALFEAAQIEAANGDLEDARGLLMRLTLLYTDARLTPWPQRGYLQLAELQEALGSDPADTLREMLQKLPDGAYAQLAQARLAATVPNNAAAALELVNAIDVGEDVTLRDWREATRRELE